MMQSFKLHRSFQWPLAALFSALIAFTIFWALALPAIELRQQRHAQLQKELTKRQQSLVLQANLPLLNKINQPLQTEAEIIATLRRLMGKGARVKFAFGTPQPIVIGTLSLTALPLTLTLSGFDADKASELIYNLSARLPNHLQLASYTYEGMSVPEKSTARLEFEIYGQAR